MEHRRLNVPRIKQRLAELNLTVEGFTEDMGLDRRTVQRLLSGKTRRPHYDTVKLMAEVLALQPRDLLLLAGADAATDAAPPFVLPVVELRLPITGTPLVGRAQEVAQLERLWTEGQVNICSIVAWGGVGKSALVNHWLGQLAHRGWHGAARVFGWTFFSQGTREIRASADAFLEAALRFCGDPAPSLGTPRDKGQRLARWLSAQRTLLLLDGLEPLQHPPGPSPEAGRVTDPALAALLQALALHNPGLCVLTTRWMVADLAPWHGTTVDVLALEALSEEAGAELLRQVGVRGAEAERRAAAREYTGHALALQLLGTYLRDVCGGDVRRRHEVAVLDNWAQEGGHAWRVLEAYERWFGPGPEVAVLRMLGLFDRVAHAEELAALRAAPPIAGLTEALVDLTAPQWVHVLRRLRTAGLLAPPDPRTPHAVDAHPLVRTYYRHQLCAQASAAWRAGHARLAAHLQASIMTECPATLKELEPLYTAVAHHCLAGCLQEALQVFRHRIRRGDQQFSLEQLGAFGADLAALAPFFVAPWSTFIPGVPADDARFLYQAVGECLSALGRVDEAKAPLQHALTLAHQHAQWPSSARAATALSEVYRARGDLPTALRYADQSAAYARRPGVPLEVRVRSAAFLGCALHWVGRDAEAAKTFQEAELLQQQVTPERPLLYGVPGYLYSELLLDRLNAEAAHLPLAQCVQAWHDLYQRIAQTLAWAVHDDRPTDRGLHHVSMGRVYLLAWQHPGVAVASPATAQEQAATHIARAVEYLRRSNHRNYVPRALLTRAALSRLAHHFDLAHQDVDEVVAIAQHSAMAFYLADALLERAALHVVAVQESPHAERVHLAADSLEHAKALIAQMGYARRWRQIEVLEAMLHTDA